MHALTPTTTYRNIHQKKYPSFILTISTVHLWVEAPLYHDWAKFQLRSWDFNQIGTTAQDLELEFQLKLDRKLNFLQLLENPFGYTAQIMH